VFEIDPSIDWEAEVDERIKRCRAFNELNGIDKKAWLEKTGYSEDQYYRWHSLARKTVPSSDQLVHCYITCDINPIWVWFGVGPMRLSECLSQLASDSSVSNDLAEIKGLLKELTDSDS